MANWLPKDLVDDLSAENFQARAKKVVSDFTEAWKPAPAAAPETSTQQPEQQDQTPSFTLPSFESLAPWRKKADDNLPANTQPDTSTQATQPDQISTSTPPAAPAKDDSTSAWGLPSFTSLATWRQPAPPDAPQTGAASAQPTAMPTTPRPPRVDATFVDGRQPAPEQVGVTAATDEAWARSEAARLGIDPDVAVRVANTEGGFETRARQNQKGAPAYGPYQLYIGGPGSEAVGDDALTHGIDPRNPDHQRAAITFALEHAAKNGWHDFQGAADNNIGDWDGIGKQPPPTGKNVQIADGRATPGQFSAGSYTPNQYDEGKAAGLSDEAAWAVCGPAAAIAFARSQGRNPSMAEAVDLAKSVGWTADNGMAGPQSEQALLNKMGVAARLVNGAPDQQAMQADVQRGNPVIISTPGHYFVAERYDANTGKFDFGQSATILRAAGGQRWFSLDEIKQLGMGEPRAALYMDNPQSPSPSVVAGPSAAPSVTPTPDGSNRQVSYKGIDGQPQDEPIQDSGPAWERQAQDASPSFQDSQTEPATGTAPAPQAPEPWTPGQPLPSDLSMPARMPGRAAPEDASASGPIDGPAQPGAVASGIDAVGQGASATGDWIHANTPITAGAPSAPEAILQAPGVQSAVREAQGRGDLTPAERANVPGSVAAGVVRSYGAGSDTDLANRMQEIDNQAADWLTQQGRAVPKIMPSRDETWRVANPEAAQEYDDLQHQYTMAVGGMVGSVENVGPRFGAPRPGQGETPHGASERPTQPAEAALVSEPAPVATDGRPAPVDAPTASAGSVHAESPAGPTASLAPEIQQGTAQAHAALDTLEAQGIDVSAARSALQDAVRTPREATPLEPTVYEPPAPRTADAGAPPPEAPVTTSTTPEPADAGRIRGFGHYDPAGTSSEAASLAQDTRASYEANDLRRVPQAEVRARAERSLSLEPGTIERWQHEQIAAGSETAAVKGEALHQSAYGDAEAAVGAQQRFDDVHQEMQSHLDQGTKPENLPEDLKQRAAEATVDLADLKQRFSTSAEAHNVAGTAAARQLNQRKSLVSSRGAYQLSEQGRQLARDARAASEAAGKAIEKGSLDEGTATKLRNVRTRLGKAVDEGTLNRETEVQGRLGDIEKRAEEARKSVRQKRGAPEQPADAVTAKPSAPKDESFAEKLGRLKRQHGAAEDAGDLTAATRLQAEIDGTLDEIKLDAARRAQQILNQKKAPLSPEEAQRAVDEAIGNRAVSRIRREAVDDAKGYTQGRFLSRFDQDLGKKLDAAVKKQAADEASLTKSIDLSVQRKIDAALSAEKRAGVKEQVRTMAEHAKTLMDRIKEDPSFEGLRPELDYTLRTMAEHSNVGETAAGVLRQRFADQLDEGAFKFQGDMERRLSDASKTEAKRLNQEIEASRIRGVMQQIDDVLKNPTGPDAMERLRGLHADLAEVSLTGFEKSSALRKRLYQKNLLAVGMKQGDDMDALIKGLARVDPEDPASIRPILAAIQRPTLWGILRELQFVNMLSSPITHLTNATSNIYQITGRLLLNNPLEFIGSGGTSTGTGAAFQGAARGLAHGGALAKTVMKTGINPEAVDRAMETGAFGGVGRELLTEKFGRIGAVMHVISTRPLEAMDAMLGHVAFSSAVDQYAQRTADKMLAEGSAAVKGMSREAAKDYVRDHAWDYPEIIQKSGKISDYSLLKSRDIEGGGWSRVERGLRQVAGLRNVPENPGVSDYIVSGLTDFIAPFFNVPLNFAKQGADRTVGAPINAAKWAIALANGDRTAAGEHFARAAIGAGTMTTAAVLAAGGNLTDDGPTDAGQRRIWAENHQPSSWRIPGTSAWHSYQGTPWAIPFATVAGATSAYEEAQKAGEKKGLPDAEALAKTGVGAYKGAVAGFLSQSFMQNIQQQYSFLTGQDNGPSALAANVASATSRYTPIVGSSLMNFLARVTDNMERDAGRPQNYSDVPQNVGARIAARVPGLREYLDTRIGAYGEDVRNTTGAAINTQPLPNANDPITERLEKSGVGMPTAPTSLPARGMPRGTSVEIPLNMQEQRLFQQEWGKAYRHILEQTGATDENRFPADALQKMRDDAREQAQSAVERQIGSQELSRRVQGAMSVKKAS